jgi:hypothetical protein
MYAGNGGSFSAGGRFWAGGLSAALQARVAELTQPM